MRTAEDWGIPCVNSSCVHHGLLGMKNITSKTTYKTKSGKRRVFLCKSCGTSFSETRNTVFFDLRVPEQDVIRALKLILVGTTITGISFALDYSEETILRWLSRAHKKAKEINKIILEDVTVTQIQLDEMWSFVKRKIRQEANDQTESPEGVNDGRQWVWISYAPETRLILAAIVGPRTRQTAMHLIAITASVVVGVPCFFSDGFSCYLQALIEQYHTIKVFEKTGKPGRPRNPIKEPLPGLVYGQVVKEKTNGRLVKISHKVILGAERLAALGLHIGTSLLERLNLTFRQSLAPLVRKTLGFSKKRDNLQAQVTFFQVFYNLARPHMSLRVDLNRPSERFQQRYTDRTPGMAAGLTDHVWTFRELLTARMAVTP